MKAQETETLAVLLIEDQLAEVDFVREMLTQVREVDFRITHRERLRDGLEHLQGHPVDVVLLDLCLPDSTGYATFQTTYQSAPAVPIILMTNMDDEAQAIRAVREGAQDYLIKRKVDSCLLARSIRYAIERQRADEALRRSEERYVLAVRGSNDGVWDWDLTTGEVYYSARWQGILGFAEGELKGGIDAWTSRVHPDDAAEFRHTLENHLAGDDDHFAHEYRIRAKDGSCLWVLSRGTKVADETGRPVRMAGSLTDITARKQAEQQLVYDALHDKLTSLPNRTLLLDRLELAVRALHARESKEFALLVLGLDRFKNVNESLGHGFGDRLLQRIGSVLDATIRPGDTLARLGGDEFGVLLADVHTPAQVTHAASRILDACSGHFEIAGQEVFATASIGIALGSANYTKAQDVLRDADIALYWAKTGGKACYQVFDREMHRRVAQLQRLEIDLRRAVERQEFEIHYQPIVSLASGTLVGFEALIRWHHPKQGLVLPQEFINAAEETGLIVPIGWWTLREACRQTRQWQKDFPGRSSLAISVNISTRLFNQPDLVAGIQRIIEEVGLSPSSLRLEITESLVLDHGEEALAKLRELRQLGIGLHVDDFGTGYSSLSYLQKFAYDSLKIDRSFVREITEPNGSGAIVQTIIALGKLLGMNIIAEGVENHHQLAYLRKLSCPEVQGYWFSRPIDKAGTERMLANPPAWSEVCIN